jgi:A/G-specific adenine glycosylase
MKALSFPQIAKIQKKLLQWYPKNGRDLPWRRTTDPYAIWVSEIMLQQTRAVAVTPYYRRFLSAFPTVHALAEAPRDQVMKLWEGLGYYSRARNLHLAAAILARERGGRLPGDPRDLEALPGIGRSTAGAIAAIAFRADAPILDANAKRVIARAFAVTDRLSLPSVERRLWTISRGLILPGKGRETALALMDLGATVCVPRRPRCPACPLNVHCEGHRDGIQETIPAKAARKFLPHHDVVVAWIADGKGRVLTGRRPDRGLLGGLWELPGGRRKPEETKREALRRELRERWGMRVEVGDRLASLPQGFSHFRTTVHAYRCRRKDGRPGPEREWRWVRPEDLADLAFPRTYRRLVETVFPLSVKGKPGPFRSFSRAPSRKRRGGRRSS